jgi:uncharacterized protein
MTLKLLVPVPALLLLPPGARAQQRLPILDVHLHASAADGNGPPPMALCVPVLTQVTALDPNRAWRDVWMAAVKKPPCSDPIWSPMTDAAVMEQTIAVLHRRNIIGVLSGTPERVRRWSAAAPTRFIPSVQFQLDHDVISPGSLRRLFESGSFAVLGEVTNQYFGITPDDERMEPYWELAEELDVPVAIHLGEGPPGAPYLGSPKYRARLTSPFLLEEVLMRHPRLRVSVMHYGSPLIEEMIAMLGAYPQLYVDIGGIQWFYPRAYFYEQLRRLVDAGFGKRVMFGSDQMNWPGIIEPAIAIVEEAPFLSAEQKRDIFYNNAARFLRLSEKEIAKHHGR